MTYGCFFYHREALHASARLAESKSSLLVSSNSATKTATPAAKYAAAAAATDAAEVTHTLLYAPDPDLVASKLTIINK
jgi:hypothetical protein